MKRRKQTKWTRRNRRRTIKRKERTAIILRWQPKTNYHKQKKKEESEAEKDRQEGTGHTQLRERNTGNLTIKTQVMDSQEEKEETREICTEKERNKIKDTDE